MITTQVIPIELARSRAQEKRAFAFLMDELSTATAQSKYRDAAMQAHSLGLVQHETHNNAEEEEKGLPSNKCNSMTRLRSRTQRPLPIRPSEELLEHADLHSFDSEAWRGDASTRCLEGSGSSESKPRAQRYGTAYVSGY